MRSVSRIESARANTDADRSDSEPCGSSVDSGFADRSDSGHSDWFFQITSRLLGTDNDAGYQLSLLTGFLDRSCYRYTTKDRAARRQPPGYLLRTLLRRPDGWVWLEAVMDGCEEDWWRELREAKKIWDAIEAARRGD